MWHIPFFWIPHIPEMLITGREREFWEFWIKAETWNPYAISEVAIDFYHAGYYGKKKGTPPKGDEKKIPWIPHFFPDGTWDKNNPHDNRIGANYPQNPPDSTEFVVQAKMIACFLMIETFNPMQGYSSLDDLDKSAEARARKMFIVESSFIAKFKTGDNIVYHRPGHRNRAHRCRGRHGARTPPRRPSSSPGPAGVGGRGRGPPRRWA